MFKRSKVNLQGAGAYCCGLPHSLLVYAQREQNSHLANIVVGGMHLLSALTISGDDLGDNETVSGEDGDERDENSQKPVNPVPVCVKEIEQGLFGHAA